MVELSCRLNCRTPLRMEGCSGRTKGVGGGGYHPPLGTGMGNRVWDTGYGVRGTLSAIQAHPQALPRALKHLITQTLRHSGTQALNYYVKHVSKYSPRWGKDHRTQSLIVLMMMLST